MPVGKVVSRAWLVTLGWHQSKAWQSSISSPDLTSQLTPVPVARVSRVKAGAKERNLDGRHPLQ